MMNKVLINLILCLFVVSVQGQQKDTRNNTVILLKNLKRSIYDYIKNNHTEEEIQKLYLFDLESTHVYFKKEKEVKFRVVNIKEFFNTNLTDYDMQLQFNDPNKQHMIFSKYGEIYITEKSKALET